jgi:hypothetical protein
MRATVVDAHCHPLGWSVFSAVFIFAEAENVVKKFRRRSGEVLSRCEKRATSSGLVQVVPAFGAVSFAQQSRNGVHTE